MTWSITKYFQISKWIRDTDHLNTLANCFEAILMKYRENPHNFGNISEFIQLARNTARDGAPQPSKTVLKALKEMLQEISNMDLMQAFLGRHRTIIGGTFGNQWSSGKMYCFLTHVISWDGNEQHARAFHHDHCIYTRNMTSDDSAHLGTNCGAYFREKIVQICKGQGCIPTYSTALNDAKNAAYTPRGERRASLSSSSSSVGSSGSMTPRQTPFPTPRTPRIEQTPLPTPRELSKAPISSNFLLTFLMSKEFLNFFDENSANKLPYLKGLYDIIAFYRRNYGMQLLNYLPLSIAFFETLEKLPIIQNCLAEISSKSLETISIEDRKEQILFIEVLKMKIMYEVWIQEDSVYPFTYECQYGDSVWKQDPITLKFAFSKCSKLAEIVRAA